jgi:hypothetical protein
LDTVATVVGWDVVGWDVVGWDVVGCDVVVSFTTFEECLVEAGTVLNINKQITTFDNEIKR